MDFKDKVVYQIYPKSFKDSNHDGIGDIKGILEKLDYLQLLGVDYIWLNPVFPSPFHDNGYDIENYYDIHPLFGTMEDMDRLISESGKRGISIMLDMVFNHTSTAHPWFKKALEGDQEYKDRYFFRKGIGGKPPTNWESKFKGNAWKYVDKLDEYYLHLFHEAQADLNWKNEEVRKEAARIVNFWLDKGIKGFRFDVINLIDKESLCDDNEGVGKRFYTDRPLVHAYLQELNRNSFGNVPDALTVGEMSSTSIENCIKYTNPDSHELSMAFSFHHLKVDYDNRNRWGVKPFDFKELKQILDDWQMGLTDGGGWNALFWCCHDQPRIVSRYGDDKRYRKESAKMLATAIHMLRGTPYIYQGEEIGMTNAGFGNMDSYRDIDAFHCYREMKAEGLEEADIRFFLQSRSRDNARTPMQWCDELNAGFSDVKPWIDPIGNYHEINVKQCLEDKDSIFYYYKELIRLRKTYRVIQEGRYEPMLKEHESVYAYKRVLEGDELLVINHFYDDEPVIWIDASQYDIMLSNVKRNTLMDKLVLMPYEALVLRKKVRDK